MDHHKEIIVVMKESSLKVTLHVGLHKTGTTSIQDTLGDKFNNQLLKEQGILYPTFFGKRHNVRFSNAFMTHPEDEAAKKDAPPYGEHRLSKQEKKISEMGQGLKEAVQEMNISHVIIVDEGVSVLRPDNIRRIKHFFEQFSNYAIEFQVMVYTRHPLNWGNSNVVQLLRYYGDQSMAELIDRNAERILPTLFRERVGHFTDIFGSEHVKVNSFEYALKNNDELVHHFLYQLHMPSNIIDKMKIVNQNEGVSTFTALFYDYLNQRLPRLVKGKANAERDQRDHLKLANIRGHKYKLSFDDQRRLLKSSELDRKWLKDHFQIDYMDDSLMKREVYKDIERSYNDIQDFYPLLTKPLRDMMVDFLDNELKHQVPKENRESCKELVTTLKASEEEIIHIHEVEHRMKQKLQFKTKDNGVFYRELGMLMESYAHWDAARIFMSKAKLLRPNDHTVRKKLNLYNQKDSIVLDQSIVGKKRSHTKWLNKCMYVGVAGALYFAYRYTFKNN